ncbi:MAG: hypothetical protein ABI473_11510 [Candidatus Dormibacter sp.]
MPPRAEPEDDNRKIMIASLRHFDAFAKIGGSWHFAERKLLLDCVGLALIAVGVRGHGAVRLVGIIGWVPLAAGVCGVCVLGSVVGRPVQGEAFRRSTAS